MGMPAKEYKSEEKQLGFQMLPHASRVGQAKNATPRPPKKEAYQDLPGIFCKRCYYVLLMMELLYSSSANQHFQISQSPRRCRFLQRMNPSLRDLYYLDRCARLRYTWFSDSDGSAHKPRLPRRHLLYNIPSNPPIAGYSCFIMQRRCALEPRDQL